MCTQTAGVDTQTYFAGRPAGFECKWREDADTNTRHIWVHTDAWRGSTDTYEGSQRAANDTQEYTRQHTEAFYSGIYWNMDSICRHMDSCSRHMDKCSRHTQTHGHTDSSQIKADPFSARTTTADTWTQDSSQIKVDPFSERTSAADTWTQRQPLPTQRHLLHTHNACPRHRNSCSRHTDSCCRHKDIQTGAKDMHLATS